MYTWNEKEYAEGSGAKLDSPDPRIQPGAEVLVGRAWEHGWNPDGRMDHYLGTRQLVCSVDDEDVHLARVRSSWGQHWTFACSELLVLRTADGEPTDEEEWLSSVRVGDRWEAPFGSITRWAIRAGILVPDGGNGYKPAPIRLVLALGEATKTEEKPTEERSTPGYLAPQSKQDGAGNHAIGYVAGVAERPRAPLFSESTLAQDELNRTYEFLAGKLKTLREAAELEGNRERLRGICRAQILVLLAGTVDRAERRTQENALARAVDACPSGAVMVLRDVTRTFTVTPKVIKAAEEQLALLTGRRSEHEDQSGEEINRSLREWLGRPCRSGK